MIEVYEKDYIAAWETVLNDLDVASFSGPRTAEALAILAAPTSPLRGFLKTVSEHTLLVQETAATPSASGVTGRLTGLFNKGKEAMGLRATVPPGTLITRHFAPIHRLVAGDGGSAPIDGVLAKVGQLQQKLSPIGAGIGQTRSDPGTSAAIGEIAKSLNQDAAALPPPVGAVVTQVGRRAVSEATGGIRSNLLSTYQQDVMRPCVDAIEGRYPFSPTSAVDVPLADFGRVFGHGGVFDSFFRANLAQLVDTARNPWTWRADASGAVVGSSAMLRQFELAGRIRDAFFRPGAQMPELRFTVTPAELDALATRFLLEIDGQSFDYRHGPERNWSALWPGPNPGVAAATFEERSGARPNMVYQGPWAWFRLVNAGQLQRETDVRHVISLQSGGHLARVKVEAASILNPFAMREWQRFRCGI